MTIKFANINDVPKIFSLFARTYNENYSHLNLGEKTFCDNLAKGKYKSIVCIKDDIIVGHAGIHLCSDYHILNALVIDPSKRNQGIGGSLFMKRLDYCLNQKVSWIIGYAMLQHQWSQRLYDDNFFPIGLEVGYEDVYASDDDIWNRQKSNAEIILCRNVGTEQKTIMFDEDIINSKKEIQDIADKMGIYSKWNKITSKNNCIFLGFTPTPYTLFNYNYLDISKNQIDFDKMKPFSSKSIDFINSIKIKLKMTTI